MVKVVPNIEYHSNPIYSVPVVGPLIAIVEGIVVRVIFSSTLKTVQSIPLGFAWAFNIENVTEVDYDTIIWSGFDLAYYKGLGGIKNQTVGLHHYLFSLDSGSADADSNKIGVTYDNEDF